MSGGPMKFRGLDPSIGRTSQCIMSVWDYDPVTEMAIMRDPLIGNHEDLPAVVDWVIELEEEEETNSIGVDAIGLGAGALGFLQRASFGQRVTAFVASSRPSFEWEKPPGMKHSAHCECTGCLMDRSYVNYKSRIAHQFRQAAYKGKVKIPNHDLLKRDMQGYKLVKIGGRWKVEDPKISPDFGDAALIGWAQIDLGSNFWIGG